MAKVIYLEPALVPPAGEDWVFIRHLPNGQWEGIGSIAYHDGPKFYVPEHIAEEDLEEVLTDAQTWADLNGVSTIFVQKVARAQKS